MSGLAARRGGLVHVGSAGGIAGSFLAISYLTADFAPDPVAAGASAYNALVPTSLIPRTHCRKREDAYRGRDLD